MKRTSCPKCIAGRALGRIGRIAEAEGSASTSTQEADAAHAALLAITRAGALCDRHVAGLIASRRLERAHKRADKRAAETAGAR